TGLHRDHGCLFPDDPGYDNEGHVQSLVLEQVQGRQAAEPWHGPIGEYQLPLLLIKGRAHGLGGIHPLKRRSIAALLQLTEEQDGVIFRILDNQDAKWLAHVTPTSVRVPVRSGPASTIPIAPR